MECPDESEDDEMGASSTGALVAEGTSGQQLPFLEPADDLLDRLARVLVLDQLTGRLVGRRFTARTVVFEPPSPTWSDSMPTSPVALVSSGFFFAPMIALSDG